MFAMLSDMGRRYVRQPRREPAANGRRFKSMSRHLMRDAGVDHAHAEWHETALQAGVAARG